MLKILKFYPHNSFMLRLYLALIGIILGVAAHMQLVRLWRNSTAMWLLLLSVVIYFILYKIFLLFKETKQLTVKYLTRLFNYILVICLAALFGFSWTNYLANLKMQQQLPKQLENQNLLVVGLIVDVPKKSKNGWRWNLKVEQAYRIIAGENNKPIRLKEVNIPKFIDLGWYETSPSYRQASKQKNQLPQLQSGQRWLLPVQLKRPHGNFNLGGFDYELYMWRSNTHAVGSVRTKKFVEDAGVAKQFQAFLTQPKQWQNLDMNVSNKAYLLGQNPWLAPISWLRQNITQRIQQQLDNEPQAARMIAALTVGAQNELTQEDWQVFRNTGVVHLVSISGMHITMFAIFAMWLTSLLWTRVPWFCERVPAQKMGMIIGLILALCYAVLSGWGVPAQRTSLMLLLFVFLRLSGWRWPISLVWLLVMVVVLCFDPWAFFQPGFWLSFIATAVLFSFDLDRTKNNDSGITRLNRMEDVPVVGFWLKLPQRVMATIRQQWLISLALMPLTILFFQMLSWIGVVANLVAIPLVSLVITPLSIFGLLHPIFWQISVYAIDVFYWWVELLGNSPLTMSIVAKAPWFFTALAMLGAVIAILPLPLSWRSMGVVSLLPLFIWQPYRPNFSEFKIFFFDVGHGSAIAVLTRQHLLLYNAGPEYSATTNAAQRVLFPFFDSFGVKPDYLIISHQDLANTGGAYQLLKRYPQLTWMGAVAEFHPLHQLKPAIQLCNSGQKWNWDGVDFEILYPTQQSYNKNKKNTDDYSCILRISNQSEAIILASSLDAKQEEQLIQYYEKQPEKLRTRGIVTPHNGKSISSSVLYLQALRPDWAVIQSGYLDSRYPDDQAVQRYANQSIDLYKTSTCGMAVWQSHKPEKLKCWRQQKGKYWNFLIYD